MVGEEWDPGASAPFDPIASKTAEILNMEVTILNGENLDNLDLFLSHKSYSGTSITATTP
jgi:uridylate kinase